MSNAYEDLKAVFSNTDLLETSLTHRSWVNENPGKRRSNERLEFLGDAILEFIVSEDLYEKFPDKEEGFLTALRAKLVNTISLSEAARKLNLGDYLYLSKGEEEGGGRDNQSLLADTVEAVIGALFLDKGIEQAKKFIEKNIVTDLQKKANEQLKDPKSLLQEIVQSRGLLTPRYQVISEEGPDHAKKFNIGVIIDGVNLGVGTGKNKSEAAQNAAQKALDSLSK